MQLQPLPAACRFFPCSTSHSGAAIALESHCAVRFVPKEGTAMDMSFARARAASRAKVRRLASDEGFPGQTLLHIDTDGLTMQSAGGAPASIRLRPSGSRGAVSVAQDCRGCPMSATDLLEALPDLLVVLHRDGTLVGCHGGRGVGALKPATDSVGKPVEVSWPESVAGLARQLTRHALAGRRAAESAFEHDGHPYEMRISAHSANTVLCVIRTVLQDPVQGAPE